MPPITFIENPYVVYERIDGILHASFKPGITIDLEGARQILEDRLKITGDDTLPAIIDVRVLKAITKEARDLLSTDRGQLGIKASAMLISGYLSSTIANFFLKVNVKKNKFPVKTFSDRSKALDWLAQFK